MKLTPEKLAELRSLLERASKLPWEARVAKSKREGQPDYYMGVYDCNAQVIADADSNGLANEKLIVEAVNALPYLLDTIEELENKLKEKFQNEVNF